MVVASIDIQDGKVVQLRQGQELVLERDDPEALAREFDRYGEIALIDLDAAMGKGDNRPLLKKLLPLGDCRVGGGIRTVDQAKELVSLGAKKIIVGSVAFRISERKGAGKEGGEFGVNHQFLEQLAKKIGPEKIIVAVDARNGEIVVDGWKTPTGLPLVETAQAVQAYAGELLYTCVEREGTMTGIDLEAVRALKQAVRCEVTVAGGVQSLEEITALSRLGCDVQLGMALYTGKVGLADAFVASLAWDKGELLPVIAQTPDGQVLMLGYADREAVAESFKRNKLCFHSRSRNTLWMKGETSGNTLDLIRMRADCDRDAILATVAPVGPTCHRGSWSCFGDQRYTWELLQSIVEERLRNPRPGSYTASLDDELVRDKVREEAEEVCTAQSHEEIVWEVADLLYFTTVLMSRAGVSVAEVLRELERRHKK
ncbi:MAG: phosphoribosyl-ATP diphosphatase [Treponemataceae bacterium]|nr:phosphoribosyl-ATP diphosphatase [Treponemataceae bacterium]